MPLLVKTKASCNARVAYSLTPCAKTSAESSSQKPGSKELDAKIASYFNENGIAFYTAASLSCLSHNRGENEVGQTKSASKLQGTSST